DQMIELISIEAQMRVHLGKPAIDHNFLVDMTVRAAENMLLEYTGPRPRQKINPFFGGINKTMYYTLCRVTEAAGLRRKEPSRFFTEPDFWAKYSAQVVDIKIKPRQNLARIQKSMFKVCYTLVREHYEQHHPEDIRHAELVALFLFNFWNATGLLPMTQ